MWDGCEGHLLTRNVREFRNALPGHVLAERVELHRCVLFERGRFVESREARLAERHSALLTRELGTLATFVAARLAVDLFHLLALEALDTLDGDGIGSVARGADQYELYGCVISSAQIYLDTFSHTP